MSKNSTIHPNSQVREAVYKCLFIILSFTKSSNDFIDPQLLFLDQPNEQRDYQTAAGSSGYSTQLNDNYREPAQTRSRGLNSTDNGNSGFEEIVVSKIRKSKSNGAKQKSSSKSNPYFNDYNDQLEGEEKQSNTAGSRIAVKPKKSSKNEPYFHEYDDQPMPAKVDVRKARKNSRVKGVKSERKFDNYSDQGVPAEEEKQGRGDGSGYTAGVSSGDRVNHPYNFSYGDQGMPDEVRMPVDTGYTAGMTTGKRVNQPYNFAYGDQGLPDEEKKSRPDNGIAAGITAKPNKYNPYFYAWDPASSTWNRPDAKKQQIDPNYVAGISTASRASHPYNYAWGMSI